MSYRFAVANRPTIRTDTAALTLRLLTLLQRFPVRHRKEDVHGLRTTVRRLEVQLGKCPAKLSGSLKRLRKKAGKVRDIDVHLGLLKTVLPPGSSPSLQRQALQLRKSLESSRKRHLASLQGTISSAAPRLASKLPSSAERASAHAPHAEHVSQYLSHARQHFLQWTTEIPRDSRQLHQLRILTKQLRYSLEPLQAIPEAATFAGKLKQVQDAIGSWHDWATLQQLAERHLPAEPLSALLRARAAREYRQARRTAAGVRSWMQGELSASAPGSRSQLHVVKAG